MAFVVYGFQIRTDWNISSNTKVLLCGKPKTKDLQLTIYVRKTSNHLFRCVLEDYILWNIGSALILKSCSCQHWNILMTSGGFSYNPWTSYNKLQYSEDIQTIFYVPFVMLIWYSEDIDYFLIASFQYLAHGCAGTRSFPTT